MSMEPAARPTHVEARDESPAAPRKRHSNWWYLLVLLPLIGLLYPGFYSTMHPMLGGVPFYIWYQFAWVPAAVVVTVTISRLTD